MPTLFRPGARPARLLVWYFIALGIAVFITALSQASVGSMYSTLLEYYEYVAEEGIREETTNFILEDFASTIVPYFTGFWGIVILCVAGIFVNRSDFYRVLAGILTPRETVILSTHLIEEVSGFVGRAILLHKGGGAGRRHDRQPGGYGQAPDRLRQGGLQLPRRPCQSGARPYVRRGGVSMKKLYASLISLAVVLCLLVSAVTVVSMELCGDGENVTVTHEVIYGDLSALDGLSVISRHHYGYALLWETSLAFGDGLTCDTELSFHSSQTAMKETISVPGDVKTGFNIFSDYTGTIPFEPYENNYGFPAEYARLLDSLSGIGTATSVYALRDYVDEIPLWFECGEPELVTHNNWDFEENEKEPWRTTAAKLLDYFAIPLPQDASIRFTVVRREETIKRSYEIIGAPQKVDSESFASEDAVYMALRFTGETDSADIDSIAQGHGVYRIPLDKTKTRAEQLLVDQIIRFYPLDSDVNVLRLRPDPVTGHLLLFAEQGESLSLLVIDKTDGHLISETALHPVVPTNYALTVGEDVTLLFDTRRIQVLSRREDRFYALDSMIYPREEYHWDEPAILTNYNYVFAYDGERLAFLQNDPIEGLRIFVFRDGEVVAHVLCKKAPSIKRSATTSSARR